MKEATEARLRARGWRVGSASDFLELTPEERAFVELKVALGEALRRKREASGLSQADLAEKAGSSQSRISRMEAADGSVTVDLMIRVLLALGTSRQELAEIVGPERRTA